MITPAQYDEFVWGKIDPNVKVAGDVSIQQWCGLKIPAEAGEYAGEIVKRDYHGKDVDSQALLYELGDVLFYVSAAAQAFGVSLTTIMEMNHAKLTLRGEYANYLNQKQEATPQIDNPYSEVIADLRRTLRQFEDRAGTAPAESPE